MNDSGFLLAGYTLTELLDIYRIDLFELYLPYVDQHIYDPEYGGFLCHITREGQHVTNHKRTWYDGRGIWVYSHLYQHFGQKKEYLDRALQTQQFLQSMKSKDYPFWPWGYDRSGVTLDGHRADIYGSLFAAEGLVGLANATGEEIYWKQSREILQSCMAEYDQNTYEYIPHYKSDQLIQAPRVLGHWMIFLNLCGQLMEFQESDEIRTISDRCIEALMEHHLHPDFDLFIEYLHHDGTIPDTPLDQFAYVGHGIEVLWMLMAEAHRRGDEDLYGNASRLFKKHVEVAWDPVYGGFFHELTHVERNDWLLEKVLWAQEEVLTGLMLMIEHDRDPWAIRWFGRVYPYVREHFILHDHPAKLWVNGGNRKMDEHHQVDRFENYHHPRHLMMNIRSLENMVDQAESGIGNRDWE